MRRNGIPTIEMLDVDGTPTAVHAYGPESGRVVLGLHGFRGSHHGLEPLALELAHRGLRVLLPDLPGAGATGLLTGAHDTDGHRRWGSALLRKIGNVELLLGHSFGTVVAAAMMTEAPSVSGTVLLNPITSSASEVVRRGGSALTGLYYELLLRLPRPLAMWILHEPVTAGLVGGLMTRTPDRALRRWIIEQHRVHASATHDLDAVVETYRAAVDDTVRDHLDGLRGDVLVLAGEHDMLAPAALQRAFVRELPHARLDIMPGTGHLVPMEVPAAAADRILARFGGGAGTRTAGSRVLVGADGTVPTARRGGARELVGRSARVA